MNDDNKTLLTLWIEGQQDDGTPYFGCKIIKTKNFFMPIFQGYIPELFHGYIPELEIQLEEWIITEYKEKNLDMECLYFIEAHEFENIGQPELYEAGFQMRIVEKIGDGESQEKFNWDKAIEKWMGKE